MVGTSPGDWSEIILGVRSRKIIDNFISIVNIYYSFVFLCSFSRVVKYSFSSPELGITLGIHTPVSFA